MRQVAPKLSSLLSDPRVFSSRETSRLFGNRFVDAMVVEAEEENKLEKVWRAGGHQNRNWNQRTYRDGDRSTFGGTTNRFQPYSSTQQGRQRGGYPNRLVFSNIKNTVVPPVGARSAYFVEQWAQLTNDSWVADVIKKGYFIDFLSEPVQTNIPNELVFSMAMQTICEKEIAELLKKKVIEHVQNVKKNEFVSSMFIIPKKTGGYRPIINLKRLNSFVHYEHFKNGNHGHG